MSKQALISPNEKPIQYISSWTNDIPPQPIYSDIPNSCRVAEVMNESFEVAPPLFWTPCEDNVNATDYYYDLENESINLIENAPYPNNT